MAASHGLIEVPAESSGAAALNGSQGADLLSPYQNLKKSLNPG
jgi:hypothetical protein